jgi:hypothetical protein
MLAPRLSQGEGPTTLHRSYSDNPFIMTEQRYPGYTPRDAYPRGGPPIYRSNLSYEQEHPSRQQSRMSFSYAMDPYQIRDSQRSQYGFREETHAGSHEGAYYVPSRHERPPSAMSEWERAREEMCYPPQSLQRVANEEVPSPAGRRSSFPGQFLHTNAPPQHQSYPAEPSYPMERRPHPAEPGYPPNPSNQPRPLSGHFGEFRGGFSSDTWVPAPLPSYPQARDFQPGNSSNHYLGRLESLFQDD